MKKLKNLILVLIILGGLFFLFGPEIIPENFQPQEILDTAANSDVIIIFNSGGWGDTPLEEAQDFAPIIKGIQETLNGWGYKSIVVPYNRTKNDFWGRIAGVKEFFNSFQNSSRTLAEEIEFLTAKLPDKKIIIAGLSSGGTFVTETYKKVSQELRGSVYTIAVGTPFWATPIKSDNILQIKNNGQDSLSEGQVGPLLFSLIKTPFKWMLSKIKGQNLSFSKVFQAPGHDYSWLSEETSSQIVTFLEDKLR